MIKLGITGGSGCGKTTVSDILRSRGIDVVDCDVLAREVVRAGKPALAEIAARFGEAYIRPDGTLDRKKLGGLVFLDPAALLDLNSITHRYITAELERHIQGYSGNIIGIDGAAIIESGTAAACDYVLAVLAEEAVRAARICARDGLAEEEALQRICAQKPDAFYLEHADFVIYNNGDRTVLEREVCAIIGKMVKKFETDF